MSVSQGMESGRIRRLQVTPWPAKIDWTLRSSFREGGFSMKNDKISEMSDFGKINFRNFTRQDIHCRC